jgi:uncharacterized protein YbjT (DUF2867 family)
MSQTILITGATGNIGQPLVAALKAAGAPVEVLGSPERAQGVPARQARFEDPAALTRAFEGVHTLFVLLPLVPEKLSLARHVADAARAAGVQHIVRSSGAGADPNSPLSLPRLQGEIDAVMQDSGIATTFIRPSFFMQNLTGWQREAIRSGVLYAAHGQGAQGFVDVRDIAEATAQVLLKPAEHVGRAYTLTGPQAFTDEEVTALIAQATGKAIRYQNVPDSAAEEAMAAMGTPAVVIDWLMSLNTVIQNGWGAGLTQDVQLLTGRAPRRLQDFIQENASAWA